MKSSHKIARSVLLLSNVICSGFSQTFFGSVDWYCGSYPTKPFTFFLKSLKCLVGKRSRCRSDWAWHHAVGMDRRVRRTGREGRRLIWKLITRRKNGGTDSSSGRRHHAPNCTNMHTGVRTGWPGSCAISPIYFYSRIRTIMCRLKEQRFPFLTKTSIMRFRGSYGNASFFTPYSILWHTGQKKRSNFDDTFEKKRHSATSGSLGTVR